MATYLTTAQAGKRLNLSKERVCVLIREGRLKARRNAHGFHEIAESDLEKFAKKPRKAGRPRTKVQSR